MWALAQRPWNEILVRIASLHFQRRERGVQRQAPTGERKRCGLCQPEDSHTNSTGNKANTSACVHCGAMDLCLYLGLWRNRPRRTPTSWKYYYCNSLKVVCQSRLVLPRGWLHRSDLPKRHNSGALAGSPWAWRPFCLCPSLPRAFNSGHLWFAAGTCWAWGSCQ